MRWYFYLGILLLAFANLNFFLVIQPFAQGYIPIVWFGYILFIDGIVYEVSGRSIISNHPKDFFFIVLLSVPFWLIFEGYNMITDTWFYINYTWYVHIVDFTTIMPAVLETFMLVRALGLFKNLRINVKKVKPQRYTRGAKGAIASLSLIGLFVSVMPLLYPSIGGLVMWLGMFLLIDPINRVTGRISIIQRASSGDIGLVLQLFASGIIMGILWEFWNYMAYSKWIYNLPTYLSTIKIFEMPIYGYLGYLPFAIDALLFYAMFRPFIFSNENPVMA